MEYFKSRNEMYDYYLRFFDEESPFLQILCNNCNTKKRINNKESAGRLQLEQFFRYILGFLTVGDTEGIKVLLEKYPQFVPIILRISRHFNIFFEKYSQFNWNKLGEKLSVDEFVLNVTKNKDGQKLVTTDEAALPLLRDELFMKIFKELEGPDKKPVEYRILLKNLLKTRKFSEKSARTMIRSKISLNQIESIGRHGESFGPFRSVDLEERKRRLEEDEKRNRQYRVFHKVLKALVENNKGPVEKKEFFRILVNTSHFTENEAEEWLKRGLEIRTVFEPQPNRFYTTYHSKVTDSEYDY